MYMHMWCVYLCIQVHICVGVGICMFMHIVVFTFVCGVHVWPDVLSVHPLQMNPLQDSPNSLGVFSGALLYRHSSQT